ncbi:MerR family transcriptional regulator [Rhodococcus qingshengii]|uniref:MerR family transcriptional regulator n=1 Tax=Rhodococcus qingshengii TaxID=334542 RepID=UPI001AE0FB7E|nr:MerR family transcriptional regulator [Rhodococcus qingshengii]MBP1052266.1 MerR family transcriptional regulator [Rhodococcus qingshengii]
MREHLIPIGEVAKSFGIAASTLRYYEDEGLLSARSRTGGKRWYGQRELRRLALIRMYTETGMSLEQVRSFIETDTTSEQFFTVLADQVSTLEAQISAANRAKLILEHHLTCRQERPMQCPWLLEQLDIRVEATLDFKLT